MSEKKCMATVLLLIAILQNQRFTHTTRFNGKPEMPLLPIQRGMSFLNKKALRCQYFGHKQRRISFYQNIFLERSEKKIVNIPSNSLSVVWQKRLRNGGLKMDTFRRQKTPTPLMMNCITFLSIKWRRLIRLFGLTLGQIVRSSVLPVSSILFKM